GEGHATFWGGIEMNASGGPPVYSSEGATYDDAMRMWSPPLSDPGGAFEIPKRASPSAWYDDAVRKMFIWGGQDENQHSLATGGIYDFGSATWSALPNDGAPSARYLASVVWAGDEAIVFGGLDDSFHALGDGKIYRP